MHILPNLTTEPGGEKRLSCSKPQPGCLFFSRGTAKPGAETQQAYVPFENVE